MNERGYLRQPCIAGDAVVFVCDDDLWRVDAGGGQARRLTAGLGEVGTPALSPSGRWLAYVARDEQHPEVYLMPGEGGPARRMTWLGPDAIVRGWTPDGKILFVTTYGQPFFRNYRAYTLGVDGGLPELLPYGQVNHLSFGAKGARLIGRNTADPARWKRYRGGTAGALWVDATGSGEFRRMSELKGNLTSPMWLGGRVWFLSDFEGVGNLYSCTPEGRELRRHTDHDDYYARHASTDGRRIVYQCGADVWLFDPARDETKRLEIDVRAHRTQVARKFVPPAEFLGGFDLHPAGHSVTADVRGKLFSFGLWEGAVRQHGGPDAVRFRHARWLADGSIVAVCDASGEERLHIFSGGNERKLEADIGRVVAMEPSPTGKVVALTNHRCEVLLAELDNNKVKVIAKSAFGRSEDLAWSADGAWLAYSFVVESRRSAIHLHEAASGRIVAATNGEFSDYCPAFDPAGRYLYFLSVRTFDPVYDNVIFDLSFPRGGRPYLMALQAGGKPPFDAEPRGFGKNAEEQKEPAKPQPVTIDVEGLERRIAAFPVAEGVYRQIAGLDGKVLWTLFDVAGAHGRGGLGADRPGRLECFDFASLHAETLVDKIDSFCISRDARTMLMREGKTLRALEAGKKPDPKAGEGYPQHSRESGWIDLERLRVSIDPALEWRQMLREVARLQRDQFWVEDMSGVDWPGVVRKYEALLPRVSTRGELSDLIWEMQGELGTSHAYEMLGDHRKPPAWTLGTLAADFRDDQIAHIACGDAWEAGADSPLNAIGVEARVGERIVAVNGQKVTRERPVMSHLVHQAGAKAELTIADAKKERTVLVTLLKDEVPARYRDWVERNRRWVREQSKGRVGYVHLPDMMSAGFAEFHRYFTVECERDGLVIDVRYNRGGHVSQLLLEKLARKRIGYDFSRWHQPEPYPAYSAFGPMVALTNEHAGSDGDIFSHCFKLMKIGPLVGKRTWGGVIGIYPRHPLVDGTTVTQPEFSFWFSDVGWAVENYGTDPDLDVDNAPQDYAAGRDRQLETALATVLGLIEKLKPSRPTAKDRPRLAPPPLPPRVRGQGTN
ncbi:MAG TPA: S41 family peptidase [Burkholderiales bacterium]